jgi:methylmalonyl-CoA mutase cobalamin-binding subunit
MERIRVLIGILGLDQHEVGATAGTEEIVATVERLARSAAITGL